MNYFSEDELRCQCGCGTLEFDPYFLKKINTIRDQCRFPLPVSSGYRCSNHPIEARKESGPGAHSRGLAVDLSVSGYQAFTLISIAQNNGIRRIGINQKGPRPSRFVHIDYDPSAPSPTIWSY